MGVRPALVGIRQQRISLARRNLGQNRKTSRVCEKNAGAFLNIAKHWPVYGRTSRMRCVITRAGQSMEDGFSDRVLIPVPLDFTATVAGIYHQA